MTAQANAYQVLAGPQEFLEAGFNLEAFYTDFFEYNYTQPYALLPSVPGAVNLAQTLQHKVLNTTNFEKLDTVECANAYAQQYISKWGDLLILAESSNLLYTTGMQLDCTGTTINSVEDVSSCTSCRDKVPYFCPLESQECRCPAWTGAPTYNITMNWDPPASKWNLPNLPRKRSTIFEPAYSDTVPGYILNPFVGSSHAGPTPSLYTSGLPTVYPSYAWQYPGGNDSQSLRPPFQWNPFGGIAVECWAERITESCTLNFSLTFGLIVVACNATKFICIAMTIWRHRQPALITIGDAIQSFLDRPDETTSGKCLYSGNQMHLFHEWSRSDRKATPHERLVNESRLRMLERPTYKSEKRSWASFASLGRWFACLIL